MEAKVFVQNQHGNHPLIWDKTGTVVELLPNSAYQVKMDGSGRLAKTTRQHLQRLQPLDVQPVHAMLTTMTTPYGPAALQERPGGPTRELPTHPLSRDRASRTESHPNFEPRRGTATDGTDASKPDPLMTSAQSPPKHPSELVKEDQAPALPQTPEVTPVAPEIVPPKTPPKRLSTPQRQSSRKRRPPERFSPGELHNWGGCTDRTLAVE